MNPLQLEDRHFAIVQDILQRIVPGRSVWAFGSRATGKRVKTFSDLDLAVGGSLDARAHGDLVEAFEESLLPIKVDVVELEDLSPEFRARIEMDFVVVQGANGMVG